mgnify:CR=1 FL=1
MQEVTLRVITSKKLYPLPPIPCFVGVAPNRRMATLYPLSPIFYPLPSTLYPLNRDSTRLTRDTLSD